MATNSVCVACGVQYSASEQHPELCKICSDERQYIPAEGQQWTTLEQLLEKEYENKFTEVEPGLWSIRTHPQIGIGQRAYLIQTTNGNILWDCITYLDKETIGYITQLGGVHAIVISHPHYYSTIVEWADVFDCPIYIHEADQHWITRDSVRYSFWKGEELDLNDEVTAIHLGGHFPGSCVLLWKNGTNGKGTLLVGDTLFIVPSAQGVSFLYSVPNLLPLPAKDVRYIKERMEQYEYEAIYGAFNPEIKTGGKEVVRKSAALYMACLTGGN